MKNDIVFIKNLHLEAIIGIHDFERAHKQPVQISLEMEWDNRKAAQNDDFGHALDYWTISEDLKEFVGNSSFLLVETLAEEIAKRIITTYQTPAVTVELQKPTAVFSADSVGVKIHRTTTDYELVP